MTYEPLSIRIVIYIKKGQKCFNNRPNRSQLSEKQMATIIHIIIKLAFFLGKTFMNKIENKYGNKTYLVNEIITDIEI